MPAPPNSYSQFGEDRLVWEHFAHRTPGFFVEVGASDPVRFSQTYLLEQQGWTGLLVEPLDDNCARLRQQRPRSRIFQAAAGAPDQRGSATFFVDPTDDMLSSLRTPASLPLSDPPAAHSVSVQVRTLDDLLDECGRPTVDFVSVDVEGAEVDVFRGFSLEAYRPPLLLVEDHHESVALHRHLTGRGYRLVKRTGCNDWYVPAAAPFALATWVERLSLWKEIHLDTPVRIWRRARQRSRPRHA